MIDELRKAFDLAAQQSEQEQAAIAARIKDMIEAVQVNGAPPARSDQMQDRPAGSETALDHSQAPVSELGKRLAEIRKRIVASGTPLLTWDEIDAEVAERRGEHGQSAEE